MNDQIREAVREKLGDAVTSLFPNFTPREAEGSRMPGKARAVIGMRRAGKTTFLFQCLAARLARGVPRERLVYFNFEDERLDGLEAADLGVLLEDYYRSFPCHRKHQCVTWCLDEIQIVPGWEKFVRRIMDSENVEVFLSGSSARMLSREVATTLRGRALETIITPFSFREFAMSREMTVPELNRLISPAQQSGWLACFDQYLICGGFPEAGMDAMKSHRISLLQGYVDTVLFRDVAERHGIVNLSGLRAFVRQLLRQPANLLSITKVHADFRSRGISISKETLLALLGHLEDAFLVFTIPIASRSERRQQVNPRKLYVADHSLSAAFNPAVGADRGHHLENLVACELQRRGMTLAYVKTPQGHEVDFLTTAPNGATQLIQVASNLDNPATFDREIRALLGAAPEFPRAQKILLSENPPPRNAVLPREVKWAPAWRWLLHPLAEKE